MEIKPIDLTIKNLLESSFYRIPRFQRPYSWDQENVDDFWNDAVLADDKDYFIGSFVLYKTKTHAETLFVVDGQQRLTTVTLLLAALRDALAATGNSQLAKGIQKLVERADIDNHLRFVLESETPYPYLQEYIQKDGAPALPESTGAEEESLKSAYEYLRNQLSRALTAVDDDPSVAKSKKVAEKVKKLTQIRDQVLRLKLISIQLDNEDDAYLIFETLNTRGKNLTVADLVKNFLTRMLKPTNKGVDVARDKWNSILETFDASSVDIDTDSFLYHSWLSRRDYSTKGALFKAIKTTVSKQTALSFLNELVEDADLYRGILEPESRKWQANEQNIRSSLRALMLFKVVQPVPMLLSIFRSYKNGILTCAQAEGILRSMEHFHVQFTAITSQRTGGGTALMYASAARQLLGATDGNKAAQQLKQFKGKLKERIPSKDEYDAGLKEVWYTSDNSKQRGLVRYLLARIDNYIRTGVAVDYDKMTVEHIFPEHPAPGTAAIEGVGLLGNMILLDAKTNKEVANLPPLKKLAAYKTAGVPLDPMLTKASKWGGAEIEARTKYLSNLTYSKIFQL